MLLGLMVLIQSIFSPAHAEGFKPSSSVYFGPSFQYQMLSVTSTGKDYSGILYGFALGKNWEISTAIGARTYLEIGGGVLANSTGSEKIQNFYTTFGLDLTYRAFVAGVAADYHYFSNTASAGMDSGVGVRFEGFYRLSMGKGSEVQLGGFLGQTLLFSRSTTLYGAQLRFLFSH